MRVFICSFENFYVAIPMDSISSLSLYTEELKQDTDGCNSVICCNENGNIYVSLLLLFNLPPQNIRHAIFLKDENCENKTILLSTLVECEIDITEDKIFPVPKTLNGTSFSVLFNGIRFAADTESFPTLLLDTKQLINFIKDKKI